LRRGEDGERDDELPDLLYGIGPWHLRLLIDDPWNGGRGQQLSEVVNWTPDQILMALCDRKILRHGRRRQSVDPLQLASGKDGKLPGRAADGTPIKGVIRGKSKARELMEASEAKRKEEKESKRRGRKVRCSGT